MKDKIISYKPKNEQEQTDQKNILKLLDRFDDLLWRENEIAHFTASSWIVNPQRTKVLMIYHKIYQSWSWTGGHVDGDPDFLKVALKEAKEETGINVTPITNDIIALDILHVTPHIKRGKFVGAHLHLNVTYLCEASENDVLITNQEETNGVRWIDIDEVEKCVSLEDHAMIKVYQKLNQIVKEHRYESN